MTTPLPVSSDVSSYVRDSVPRLQYRINLIQRGISSRAHPVLGKSGKQYGTAVSRSRHNGVCMEIALEDYTEAVREDLADSAAEDQQWISELVCAADGLFPLLLFKIRL
jgi:hypothetical protein